MAYFSETALPSKFHGVLAHFREEGLWRKELIGILKLISVKMANGRIILNLKFPFASFGNPEKKITARSFLSLVTFTDTVNSCVGLN